MTCAHPRPFRSFLRRADDPRVAGLRDLNACEHADQILNDPARRGLFDGWRNLYEQSDFKGISTDGQCVSGLFELGAHGAPAEAAHAAATRLLAIVSDSQRATLCHAIDSRQWRGWMNPEVYMNRFGLRLEEVDVPVRDAIHEVLRATMSPEGYKRTRMLIRINHFLGELVGAPGVMNEHSYNFNLFGTPSLTEPWGWNFYGHHVCVNCLMLGGQLVMTPVFFGAEPTCVDAGPDAGLDAFEDEERLGLQLMRSLPATEQRLAHVYQRKRDPAMPAGRIAIGDELILTGAFQDNRIIPYEGTCAASWPLPLQRLLLKLVESYVSYLPPGPKQARMQEVERHMPATHFCWIGGFGDEDPFYYRVQSPVLIIEFDHHAGVFLGNKEPEKFHVHTLVRTPNGNDYGMDLVRQHCEHNQKLRQGIGV